MYAPAVAADVVIVIVATSAQPEEALTVTATIGSATGAQDLLLAWLLHHPVATSPIGGATKPQHLDDAVAAVDLSSSVSGRCGRCKRTMCRTGWKGF
jgi:hypothetical protein